MDDSTSLTTTVVAIVVTSIFLLAAFWITIWFVIIPEWMLCFHCRTRIASIRVMDMTQLLEGSERGYRLLRLSGRKICSNCRGQLDDIPVSGLWLIGAATEYIKNTPALFAALVAIASLVVSIIALLWDIVL